MYFFSRPIGEISRKCRGSDSRIGSNSQRVSITSALAPSKDTMLPEWRACLCITAIRSKRPNAAWAERYRRVLPRRQTLSHWQKDIDLAGIRNAAALAKLPAGEQKAFTFDENVLACHACHYGTVVRLPVVDQYLARVGPTHRGRCDRSATVIEERIMTVLQRGGPGAMESALG